MKKLILVALFSAVAGGVLQAQSLYLKADIPFEFRAGKTLMPAGRYVFEEKGPWLVVRGIDTGKIAGATMSIPALGNDANTGARLTFNRYGSAYFLSKVWGGFSHDGRELVPTPSERNLAKHLERHSVDAATLAQK
jgi:hypothetical protein